MSKNKRMTMRLIADELGVSVSLVSRALSGKADQFRISKDTEQAILKVAKRHNYSPNRVARGLRLRRTSTLGLIVPNISNYFFSSVARHIERAAREKGYSIILADSQDDVAIEQKSLEVLQDLMVDGVIVAPGGVTCDHLIKASEDRFPVVCVDGYFPGSGIPYVVSDHQGGALLGTRHLLENGHREIGFLQGFPGVQVSFDRLKGYHAALREYGLTPRGDLIAGEQFSYESGREAAKAILARKRRPTALFSVNNEIALGALEAIEEAGLSVPKDISVVAFDDLPFALQLRTPLTTVTQQYEELGRRVVDLLEARIKGADPRDVQGITVPTQLVERGSVRNIGAKTKGLWEAVPATNP